MPRPLRPDHPGAFHHVYARGNGGMRLFADALDRHDYLALLSEAGSDCGWRCLAYCLMDNHVHVVLETPGGGLARGVQRAHGRYAQRFNTRHERYGHVWQGRYGSTLIGDDAQLWQVVRYVVRNPVVAGRCERASDWPWSSHRATIDDRHPTIIARARLLELFGAAGGDPVARYLAFIDDAVGSKGSDPLPNV